MFFSRFWTHIKFQTKFTISNPFGISIPMKNTVYLIENSFNGRLSWDLTKASVGNKYFPKGNVNNYPE